MTGIRICRYTRPGWTEARTGLLSGADDGTVVDLVAAWPLAFGLEVPTPSSPLDVVMRSRTLLEGLRSIEHQLTAEDSVPPGLAQRIRFDRSAVRLEVPLQPSSLRDVPAYRAHVLDGLNAIGMAKASEDDLSVLPAYYRGDPTTVVGPEDDVVAPSYADTLDFEAELAFVVAAEARDLDEDAARDAIGGYLVFNDVSVRSRQMEEMKTGIGPGKGKDFASGNVLGPAILIDPEFDLAGLSYEVRVDGEAWTSRSAGDIAWSPEQILCHLSEGQWVRPGDVVGLGTFPGGCGLELKRYPSFGSLVEISISSLGRISNRFLAPELP